MDPSQIDPILINLCLNARDAISSEGGVAIETGNVYFDNDDASRLKKAPGDYVTLIVSDNGCSMARETLKNIFEPFLSTKKTDKGIELRMATVYGIVKQNDGFINCTASLVR